MYALVSCYQKCPGVETVSIFCFAEVQKLHSRSACRNTPYEDIMYDNYVQELNTVVLIVFIFVPGWFSSASVPLTTVLVRHSYCKKLQRMIRKPGYENVFFCKHGNWLSNLQSVPIYINLHGHLNNLISKRTCILYAGYFSKVHPVEKTRLPPTVTTV